MLCNLAVSWLSQTISSSTPLFGAAGILLSLMIHHHQGAVTMVHELFATDGAGLDEVVFKMASDIQADQTTEIARMELMLEEMTKPRDP